MVVQFSTGARGRSAEERFACVEQRPEMASLSTGSVNFPDRIYDNPPQMVEKAAARMLELGVKPEIEVFDFAMLYAAVELSKRGLLAPPPHLQLVMGVRNALPVRERIADFFCSEVRELLPDATYTFAAVGRHQLDANRWALAKGGHVRTGLEDNLYFAQGRLAASNAELVERVATLCAQYGRHPASAEETRNLLHLSAR
jgi:3-keto-5-aminohexanoate cleavage enzyme